MREQRRVEIMLDGREINGIIFGARMVSSNENAERSQKRKNADLLDYGIVFQALRT